MCTCSRGLHTARRVHGTCNLQCALDHLSFLLPIHPAGPCCRTFPLEAHGCNVGNITLCAWIAAPLELNHDPESGGLLHAADGLLPESDVHAASSSSQKGDGGDDNLFFELSESSGGSKDALNLQKGPSAGEPRASIALAADNVKNGEFIGQPNVSCSRVGLHHAADEEHVAAESKSLDIAAAMFPLIPSFPPGSAEVRFWVHSLVIPMTGDTLASPPYARFSLNPGAHSIARTSLASRASSTQEPSLAGVPLWAGLFSPPPRSAEYLFEGKGGGTNASDVVSLPLGSTEAGSGRDATGGPSTPSVRVEIVAGRSLGRCDLALPEALRRIGGVFKQLNVPIWRRWRAGQRGCCLSSSRTETPAVAGLLPREEQVLAGVVSLDLAVVLSGETSSSPSGNGSSPPELTAGVITIEATGVRSRGGEEGENAGLGARQPEDAVGVGAWLTLGEGRTKVAAARFGSRGRGRNGVEDGHKGYPAAAAEEQEEEGGEEEPSRRDCAISLKSACTEFDVLALQLIRRREDEEDRRGSGDLGGLRRKGGQQGGRGGGYPVRIAVSDINELFDGRPRWVPMEHGCSDINSDRPKRCPSTGALTRGRRKARRQLEVRLLVSLAAIDPVHHHHHEQHRKTSSGGGLSIRGLGPSQEPRRPTDPRTLQDMGAAEAESEPRPGLGSPSSTATLEAWITSPRNGCTQALAAVPPLDDGAGVGTVRHRSIRGTAPKSIETGGNHLDQAGPGVFRLEILAIHGRGHKAGAACAREDSPTKTKTPPHWWVRATFSGGGREPGGDASSVDSPAGAMSLLNGDELDQIELIPATPLQRHEAGRRGFDWVVRWPRSGGVLARYPVHWTLSQSELPVVSLEVFRGQVRPSTIS